MMRFGNAHIFPAIGSSVSRFASTATLLMVFGQIGWTEECLVYANRANVFEFPACESRFVRIDFDEMDTNSALILDEFEVYGHDPNVNDAIVMRGGKASASSSLKGHTADLLNDGRFGQGSTWTAKGTRGEWVQIELPIPIQVCRVVLSRDRMNDFENGMPTHFSVRLSLDGANWRTVKSVQARLVSEAAPEITGVYAPAMPWPPSPPTRDKQGNLVFTQVGTPELPVPKVDSQGYKNLALNPKVKAFASSVYQDGNYPIHQIRHLNDGIAGNSHSWISNGEPSWVELDLGDTYWIYKTAFASDASQFFFDRAVTQFSILTAETYDADSSSSVWQTAFHYEDGIPVHWRREFVFQPVQARWIRIAIEAATSGEVRIDEFEVYGQKEQIPAEALLVKAEESDPQEVAVEKEWSESDRMRYAFIGEEHAWLKTFGHADIANYLVPYNGRVQEFSRHIGADRLPLPPLETLPQLDGQLTDWEWSEASRGVSRVAHPFDFTSGPLAECEVYAGQSQTYFYFAVRTNIVLSSHIAVISSADWNGWGIVALTDEGLMWNTYRDGILQQSVPLVGGYDPSLRCYEFRIPSKEFHTWKETGLRVGLGLGGRHTRAFGRPVNFFDAPFSLQQEGGSDGKTFSVRLAVSKNSPVLNITSNVPGQESFGLRPGASLRLVVPAMSGPIGPQHTLHLTAGEREYFLHLFRYDPTGRTLAQMNAMADRLAGKGLDVTTERRELHALQKQHDASIAANPITTPEERELFYQSRMAKRRLFFRERDLAYLEKILFVKRFPFEPSHIYTDYTDARFRPGGGVCVLSVPHIDGRFAPDQARVTMLFDATNGIARNPVTDYDNQKIYFGFRPSEEGYYHIHSMNADGSDLKQITDGPFHDFYPCCLPDGDVAFISTRCTARVFCFRGGSSILHRMDKDGNNIRPLSLASLSEWAPAMMNDGRIIWTRWEYIDKGADFSQTLWSIRPDGTHPELVFGNTIIQPNGYACGREVPGTHEISCTLVSHFGDINGPIVLIDLDKGRFNPQAITSLTPEVPWPGAWPTSECFRDPIPLAKDYFLCSHSPRDTFGLYVIDRFGNRELIYMDPNMSSMYPTFFRALPHPPALIDTQTAKTEGMGEFILADVYQGIEPTIEREKVKYIRVVEEVRHEIEMLPSGEYRKDHAEFYHWYCTPVDLIRGPYGWPTYVAKKPLGIAPVEKDGSAHFYAPVGENLYFQVLDEENNELQRMRSVVQLQPGESRSCIGCHEGRHLAPPTMQRPIAAQRPADHLSPPPWGVEPFFYEKIVQPVLDAHCVRCHDEKHPSQVDLRADIDEGGLPASYRTLILQGWVNHVDCGFNSEVAKREPLTFGTLRSKLWDVLNPGHHGVGLSDEDKLRIKTWTDLNCPLWGDYIERPRRSQLLNRQVGIAR